MSQNTIQERASMNLLSIEHQVHRQRQQRKKHKGQTPSPRTEIKISDPAENRTRAARAGLKGRD